MILNPFIYQSGGGGGPILLVTVTGATATSVTAVNGGQSVSLAYDSTAGKWWAVLPSTGTWTVTATNSGGNTKSVTVSAASVTIYEETLQLGNLPTGYTELQYIQSDGASYIDLGSKYPSGCRIIADVIYTDNSSTSARTIFGAQQGEANQYLGTAGTNRFNFKCGNQYEYTSTPVITLNTQYLIDASFVSGQSWFKVDGTTYATFTNTAPRESYNLLLFGANNNGSIQYSKIKLYSFKLYGNNSESSLEKNYIPAKRNSDNYVGVYDIVSNTFVQNAGTGSFIAGPEV